MNIKPFENYESEVRSYCRHFPAVFTTAKGSYMYDEDGNKYLDFFCGAGALNYGHNNDYIKSRIMDYLEKDGIMHALDMYTVPKREFIEFYEDNLLKPRGLDYKIQFTGPTGTNAVEAALKLARKVKKRTNIFAMMGGFHGMTLGSVALTTDAASRKGAGVPLHDVTHIPAPYMFPELDTLKYIEALLNDDHSGADKPAAIILEAIQADGGINVFDPDWLRGIRDICDRHDILMIVDDIQAGCGRSGHFFSFEPAGIVPDMVTQSKSIGGYGMPFSLLLFKPELDIWSPGEHNGTFRGFQLSMVAAKAALELMLDLKLEEKVQRQQSIIAESLERVGAMDSRLRIRGTGFIWGIDMYHFDKYGKTADKFQEECYKNGLIVECTGRGNATVKLLPDFLVSDEDLRRGMEIIETSMSSLLSSL